MSDPSGTTNSARLPADARPATEDFLRMYSLYQKQIYAFIGTYCRNPADIDEVLQETSIVLWNKFREFRSDGEFLPWAFGIARLEVLRHFRTRKDAFPFDERIFDALVEQRGQEQDAFERRCEALQQCLSKLSERDRVLVEECYRSGVQIKDVADRMRRPVNAVYQSLSRIRRSLFDCISRAIRV
jgi:RNA polymerase sigma-70 factor (ECF subfamily)